MKKFTLYTIVLLTAFFSRTEAFAQGLLFAGQLSFKNDSIHAYVSFMQEPQLGRDAEMMIEVKDAITFQNILIPDTLSVKLFMPSMGHGSASTQVSKAVDINGDILTGVYRVKNVYFIMKGMWEVNITMTDENGFSETQKFSYKLGG